METITFGSYYQEHGASKEPIEWIVLAREGGKALLLSKKVLDCKKYHEIMTTITWENCTLRHWLNGYFLSSAFNSYENSRICTTAVQNLNNPKHGTNGGNTTYDKVFLLSFDEVNKYFSQNSERTCFATAHAIEYGVGIDPINHAWWWLRSPGSYPDCAGYVYGMGEPYIGGDVVTVADCGVRPAMWINL